MANLKESQEKSDNELQIEDESIFNEAIKSILGIVEMEQEREYATNADLFDHLLTTYASEMKVYLTPESVSKDYTGVHLGPTYEDSIFKLMLKSFKNNQLLDPFYVLKIINDAQNILKEMPNIRECHLDDPLEEGCIIVGDLHGNFTDLYHIIRKYGIPGHQYKFIFNGDYVDRGERQIEVLLTVLYAFIIRPDRVFVNRGNHEDFSMNIRSTFNPNYLTDLREKFGRYFLSLFNSSSRLYTTMPIATILTNLANERYFVVHGGISEHTDLKYLQIHVK
jgi:hypothetical protein